MVKIIGITSAISLAIGSIGGYWLQKMENQPVAAKPDNGEAIAAPTGKPKQVDLRPPESKKRSELLLKYALCTNSKNIPDTVTALDDKALNDIVYRACIEVS